MTHSLPDVVTRLETQMAVARVLAGAMSLEAARRELLQTVGSALSWQLGTLWELDERGDHLVPTEIWCIEPERCAAFISDTQSRRLTRGSGLPGRVWEEGRTIWLHDVREAQNFPRLRSASEVGFRSGIAFPIRADGAVAGVVEFYATGIAEPDDATLEWLDTIGGLIGQFVSRKHAEATLRDSEERFRVFAESASDAIFTIDASSTILYANPAVERMFGYPAAELVGRSLKELIPERMRGAHDTGLAHYLRTGRRNIPWTGVELPGLRADGSEVPLEISFGEYLRGGQHFFTGIARDVSERVKQKAELQQTAAQLQSMVAELQSRTTEAEEASRAKNDFLSVISHELRTPLNAIMGYADLLLLGIPERVSNRALEQVRRIRNAAGHLLGLIEEVLTFSRTEAGDERLNVHPVDAAEIAHEAASFIKPLARDKGLLLHVNVADDLPALETDDVKLRQILLNLLTNAVKFTDRGQIDLEVFRDDGQAVFVVRDTGRGMPAEQLDRVFEPFWQAESAHTRSVGGTGIGLTVVQRLVSLLGGDVRIESEVDVGTTARVRLPISAGARAA